MSNDNFLVEENDINIAKHVCETIKDSEIRNRAVANTLAAELAAKYFTDIEIDTKTGLHNIPFITSKIDISDIYIKNNYIDVRIYFDDDKICIPKSHFDLDITPVAYMFIKLNDDLSSGYVSGFLPSSSADLDVYSDDYYVVNEDSLVSFYDVEPLLNNIEDTIPSDNFKNEIFDILDNKSELNSDALKVLLSSSEARTIFANAAKAKVMFNFISIDSNHSEQNIIQSVSEDLFIEEPFDSLTEVTLNDDFTDLAGNIEDLEPANLDADFNLDLDSDSDINDLETDLLEDFSTENITQDTEEFDNIETTSFNNEELNDSESIMTSDESGLQAEDFDIAEDSYSNEDSTIDELAEFEYTTETTPSLDIVENTNITEEDLDAFSDEIPDYKSEENTETTLEDDIPEDISNVEQYEDLSDTTNTEPIDTLFNEESMNNTESEDISVKQKKKPSVVTIVGSLVLIAALGYFGYTKIAENNTTTLKQNQTSVAYDNSNTANNSNQENTAMPNETVDNTPELTPSEESNAVSVPAIEKNLDASILVSNLNVNWEVPADYSNNPSAKRYFVKIGKIIQLRLKTELLLLNRPPITNRIALELEFNKNAHKFEIKNTVATSGEKNVDDLIRQTTQTVLDMNLNANMNVFENLSGNPILVIKL